MDALVEEKTAVLDDYTTLFKAVQKVQSDILAMSNTYGSLEGGRAALQYKSNWNKNITALRESNPGINFAVLNTENVKIYPSFIAVDGLPAGVRSSASRLPMQRQRNTVPLRCHPIRRVSTVTWF